jgi:XTP/dITP diphosphohydrolase
MPAPSLLIATNNNGKAREYADLLRPLAIDLLFLNDLDRIVEVDETGATFAQNAELKAAGYARQAGRVTLADDSGLEVDALGGIPGVFSARYGGVDTPFAEKMEMLLRELEKTGDASRRARFVAAIAVSDETGKILQTVEGICTGHIAPSPRGSRGFGYDPLFIPDGFDQTFGELSDATKQKISHRASAFSQIIPFLRGFLAV